MRTGSSDGRNLSLRPPAPSGRDGTTVGPSRLRSGDRRRGGAPGAGLPASGVAGVLLFVSVLVPAISLTYRRASADIITLRNGRSIEGDVIADDGRSVTVKVSYGSFKLDRSEIASIVERPTPEQEYEQRVAAMDAADPEAHRELATWAASRGLAARAARHRLVARDLEWSRRRAALDATDPRAHLELARWAESNDLPAPAVEHYIAAWTLDATLDGVREALERLGWHLKDGGWQDEDSYYAGIGWQRYEGRWRHPLEIVCRESEKRLREIRESLRSAENRLRAAQNARREAVRLAERAGRTRAEIPVRWAQAESRLAQLETDRQAVERDWQSALRAVDRWQLIYDLERLKAARGEANSLENAGIELDRARRWLKRATDGLAALDREILEVRTTLAGLPLAEDAAVRDWERAQAAMASADVGVASAQGEVVEVQAAVAAQAARVDAARAAWETARADLGS